MIKTCVVCNLEFEAGNRAKYCSDDCRASARGEVSCERCDERFNVTPGSSGRFCSRPCWYAFNEAATERRVCEVCGERFKVTTSEQRACSVSCGNVLKRRHVERSCEACGAAFTSAQAKRRRFCSRSCALRQRNTEGVKPVGSRTTLGTGYVQVKYEDGWQLEHRVVMEVKLGRPPDPRERVHHLNGQRDDNRPDNLELWKLKSKDPAGVRAADYHCHGCRCFEDMQEDLVALL